jgi:Transglutaminase-like superfamily
VNTSPMSRLAPATPEAHAKLRRPLSLGEKTRLARDVLTTYVRARLWLRRYELREVVAMLREAPLEIQEPHGDQLLEGVRLARIVRRTLGVLPADSRCLVRSLVLMSMLAHRGIGTVLVIGVKPRPSFEAHAWVEYLGYPLLPPGDSAYGRLLEV